MKRLTQQEVDAGHRIFTNVNRIAGGYYGRKTRQETRGYLSLNRWMMFPAYNVDSLREGTQMPLPNVFVGFDDEFKDNGAGQAECYVGVTYGNKDSMLWLREILKRQKQTQSFVSLVNGMGGGWEASVTHKIHTEYWGATPKYSAVRSIPAVQVTKSKLQTAIDASDNSLVRKGTIDPDGETVVSCVTVVSIEAETDCDCFDDDVRDAFNLFVKLLTLR